MEALAPDPYPSPFSDLTARMWNAFPAYPPYGGQFAHVVPHFIIGEGAGRDAFLDAERSVSAHAPITGRADRLTLMAQTPGGRWSYRGRWMLGQG